MDESPRRGPVVTTGAPDPNRHAHDFTSAPGMEFVSPTGLEPGSMWTTVRRGLKWAQTLKPGDVFAILDADGGEVQGLARCFALYVGPISHIPDEHLEAHHEFCHPSPVDLVVRLGGIYGHPFGLSDVVTVVVAESMRATRKPETEADLAKADAEAARARHMIETAPLNEDEVRQGPEPEDNPDPDPDSPGIGQIGVGAHAGEPPLPLTLESTVDDARRFAGLEPLGGEAGAKKLADVEGAGELGRRLQAIGEEAEAQVSTVRPPETRQMLSMPEGDPIPLEDATFNQARAAFGLAPVAATVGDQPALAILRGRKVSIQALRAAAAEALTGTAE